MPTKFIAAQPPFSAEGLLSAAVLTGTSGTVANTAKFNLAAAALSQQATAINLGGTAAQIVSIDVARTATVGKILRNGVEIEPPALNAARVGDFLSHAGAIDRIQLPVVVSQSIPQGTMVARGTPVDLVFARAVDITFNLFDRFHADLATRPVTDLLPIVRDPTIAPLLAKDATQLSDAERQTVTRALVSNNITVSDTDPARNFDVGFASLKNVVAFR